MRNLHVEAITSQNSKLVPYALWLAGPSRKPTSLISAQEGCLAKTEPMSPRQQLNPECDVSRPDQSRNLAQVPSQ